MKEALRRIWFPLLVVCVISLHAIGMSPRPSKGDPGFSMVTAEMPQKPDTIRYKNIFIKYQGKISDEYDTSTFLELFDTIPMVTARDSIFPPDSLKEIDPFRYKYYVAIIDSLVHKIVSDSLKQAGDSLDWPILDSLYTLEYNANLPTKQQVNIPTNTDYRIGVKVTKNGQVLDIDPSEITLGGKAADATKTNDYVTFTLASDDNAKYESNVVALEMEDGFKATFALNINVYKSQQGDIGAGGSGGGVTEQWVQDYVSAETSAFVTDTEMGTAISNATTDMATQTWVGSQGFATTSYVDAQIGTVLSTNF